MMGELALWRPFREVSSLHREVDDLFSRFFGDFEREFSLLGREGGWSPAVESYLEGDKLVVRVDLPGVDPRDVEIAVVGSQLTVKGERKAAREGGKDGEGYFYREVRYGRFERSVPLPEGVNADQIHARYHNGVLEVEMPAPSGMAARRIPIEAK